MVFTTGIAISSFYKEKVFTTIEQKLNNLYSYAINAATMQKKLS